MKMALALPLLFLALSAHAEKRASSACVDLNGTFKELAGDDVVTLKTVAYENHKAYAVEAQLFGTKGSFVLVSDNSERLTRMNERAVLTKTVCNGTGMSTRLKDKSSDYSLAFKVINANGDLSLIIKSKDQQLEKILVKTADSETK